MGYRLKAFRQFVNTADEHHKLIVLLLLAFLLRLNGLAFELPYIFHPDEHQYVEAGIAFLQGPENAIAELQKLNNPPLFKSALGLLYVLYARILILQPGQIQTTEESDQINVLLNVSAQRFYQQVGFFRGA